MNPRLLLDLIQKGVFHSAEAIGKAPGSLAALMGAMKSRVSSATGPKLSAAAQGVRGIGAGFASIPGALNRGIFKTTEGIGSAFENPKQTLGTAARGLKSFEPVVSSAVGRGIGAASQRISGGLTSARQIMGGIQQRAANAGFVTSPGQNAANLGQAFKSFAIVVGGPAFARTTRGLKQFSAVTGLGAVVGFFKKLGSMAIAPFTGGHSAGGAKSSSLLGVKSLSGATALLAKAFLALAGPTGVLLTVFGLRKFAEIISESNRDLAKWNGSIASSFAQLDVARMRLDIQTANATSGSATELNEAVAGMLHELQPIREQMGTLVNVVGIHLANGAKHLLEIAKAFAASTPMLKGMLDKLAEMEKEMKKGKPQEGLLNGIMQNLTDTGGEKAAPRARLQPNQFVAPPLGRNGIIDRARGRGRRNG